MAIVIIGVFGSVVPELSGIIISIPFHGFLCNKTKDILGRRDDVLVSAHKFFRLP